MDTVSRWLSDNPVPGFPKLDRKLTVDVAIVGGGMTGISTAYLLKKAGLKVAVLERNQIGTGETSHTTAHLTYVTDPRLTHLVKTFGRDHAQAVWDAGSAALNVIRDAVEKEKIQCEFAIVPGFLHLPRSAPVTEEESDQLKTEAALAADLGFEAAFLEAAPLVNRPAIRFANQAQFHPLRYLAGLAATVQGEDCHIYEKSEVTEFSKSPLKIKANGHWVSCKHLVIATHVPLQGENNVVSGALFQSKLSGYSSYAIGARLPKGSQSPACYWDTNDPYDYIRIDRQKTCDYVIYGGEDHKTGQVTDTETCFNRVEQKLLALLPKAKVHARWSGQVIQTNDAIPLIGEIVPGQFIATGFVGNGITFGTVAGIMACDAFLGRKNPWAGLFDPHRKKILGGTWEYLKENADYPFYLLKDRLKVAEGGSPSALPPGDGKILKFKGHKAACHRDDTGKLHAVSPTCTHLGCLVHWNNAEKTWDCPCHGSRFTPDGEVIAGPAETPLAKVTIPTAKKSKTTGPKKKPSKDPPKRPLPKPTRRPKQ